MVCSWHLQIASNVFFFRGKLSDKSKWEKQAAEDKKRYEKEIAAYKKKH